MPKQMQKCKEMGIARTEMWDNDLQVLEEKIIFVPEKM